NLKAPCIFMNLSVGALAQSTSVPPAGRIWTNTSCLSGFTSASPTLASSDLSLSRVVAPRGRRSPRVTVIVNACDCMQQAGSSKSVRPLPSSSMQLPQISRGGGTGPVPSVEVVVGVAPGVVGVVGAAVVVVVVAGGAGVVVGVLAGVVVVVVEVAPGVVVVVGAGVVVEVVVGPPAIVVEVVDDAGVVVVVDATGALVDVVVLTGVLEVVVVGAAAVVVVVVAAGQPAVMIGEVHEVGSVACVNSSR